MIDGLTTDDTDLNCFEDRRLDRRYRSSLRRQKQIDAVDCGYNLAAGQEFFEGVAADELIVVENAFPKTGRIGAKT